jgi:hypothetical protein
MSEYFYGFLLNMWVNRRITETKLRSYYPRYLTETELNDILSTPQNPETTTLEETISE